MLTKDAVEERVRWAKELHTSRNDLYEDLLEDYFGKNEIDMESEEDFRLRQRDCFRISNIYQAKLARLPSIRALPSKMDKEGLENALQRERFLYGLWWVNDFMIKHLYINWHCSVLGMGLIRFGWDFLNWRPRIQVGMPWHYYPWKLTANGEIPFEVYAYTERVKDIAEELERLKVKIDLPADDEEEVDVIDYQEKDIQIQLVDGKVVYSVKHSQGFTGNVPIQNLPSPTKVEGIADIEPIRDMAHYRDYLESEIATGIDWYVEPPIVFTGDRTAPDLERGKVTSINEGERFDVLKPPGPPMEAITQSSRVGATMDKTSGISPIESGQGAGSIITGPGVEALMRPTQGHVDLRRIIKEWTYMKLNERLLRLVEMKSPDRAVEVFGAYKGKGFLIGLKGSEIKGQVRNQVGWTVSSLQEWQQKLVAMLQLRGATAIAKFDMLENLEFEDPESMLDRVRAEQIEDAKREAEIIKIRALATREAEMPKVGEGEPEAPEVEQVALEKGKVEKEERPPGRPKKMITRLFRDEVLAKLQGVERLKGQVFLMGGLVTEGFTDRDIDLMLTDLLDKQTIINALPEYGGRFHFVKGSKPKGKYVEVRSVALSLEESQAREKTQEEEAGLEEEA